MRNDERGFKSILLRPFDALLAEAVEKLATRDEGRILVLESQVAALSRENTLLREMLEARLARLEQNVMLPVSGTTDAR